MPNVVTPQPDIKVFFRRLLVPGEMVSSANNTVLTPSQIVEPTCAQDMNMPSAQQVKAAFASYQPTQFKKQVVAKAMQAASDFEKRLTTAKTTIASLEQQIVNLKKSIAKLSGATISGITIDQAKLTKLQQDAAYYASTVGQAGAYFNSVHGPGTQSPLGRDHAKFVSTQANLPSLSAPPMAVNLIDNLKQILTDLIGWEYTPPQSTQSVFLINHPVIEDDLRQSLANGLNSLSAASSTTAQINALDRQRAGYETQLSDAKSDLAVLNQSFAIQPFYDPILLDCLIGPYSMNTSMNRKGQPGTGSVTFHLPLAVNGQAPNLFFGLQVNDVFDLAGLEKQVSGGSTATRGSTIPGRTLSILTANMRETLIAPFDMMQIWARRRYSVSANFPTDYYPIFTGFVTKTAVSYSGSAVTVKIDGEDVGKMIRLARINIDPQLDSSLNSLGLGVSAFGNNLIAAENAPNNQTGGQMIRGIIQGQSGSFLGMSDAVFISGVANVMAGPGAVLVTALDSTTAKSPASPAVTNRSTAIATMDIPGTTTASISGATTATKAAATLTTTTTATTIGHLSSQVVNLAWDFKNIQVNVFNDLVNNWPPYETQLKNAFRMWQTDDVTKWEVCSQIAEIQEFEFYADNMGVINYHPPLYYLNPFAPQYYIEDVDIVSESHATDEKAVVTVMELDTQPSFFANGSVPNPIMQGRAFVSVPTPVLQRYAVRYQKKSAPIFSDTTAMPSGSVSPGKADQGPRYNVEQGRTSYCRALLNRRNAELKSATVTINGTPELRLCNTIAFVGSLGAALESISLNPLVPAVPGPTSASSATSAPNSILTSLQQMLVYYISTISHSYMQGKDFTTTLGLTHGRHWTDALPSSSVGYGVSGPATDDTYASMRQFYGQEDEALNAKTFISVASAKLQFIATGNPAALAPATSSQFGFTNRPVKPQTSKTFITTLSAAVSTSHIRSWWCNNQNNKKDHTKSSLRLGEMWSNTVNSVEKAFLDAGKAMMNAGQEVYKFLKTGIGKDAKMLFAYAAKAEKFAIAELKLAAAQAAAILANPEVTAFKAYLGNKNFKFVLRQKFTSGQALQETGASAFLAPIQQLGIDTSAITSFAFPIAAYIYVAQSPISFNHAKETVASQAILSDLPTFLGHTIKGMPQIFRVPGIGTFNFVLTSTVDRQHASISIPSLPAAPTPLSFTSMLTSFTAPTPRSSAAPVITSDSNASGKIGAPFTYAIVALNGPTSYGAKGLPSGLHINKTTGVISGAPTSGTSAPKIVSATKAAAPTVGPAMPVTTATLAPASTGTTIVTVSATNSSGTGTKELYLMISPSTTGQLQQEYYIMGVAFAVINPKC